MDTEITTIIFSKNRACQLELLLRNLNIPAVVIYTYDSEYRSGYEKLIKMYPDIEFVWQTDFKAQVLEYFDKYQGEYIMFLVDDDVMLEPFEEDCPEFEEFKRNQDILCLSLRLVPYYKRAPVMKNNTWDWRGLRHDWGYPMSLSAHIFRKKDILPIFIDKPFDIPNDLEVVLRKNPPNKPLMLCPDKPYIINVPANRVQDKYPKENMEVPARDINNKFLKGFRISLENVIEKAKVCRSCFLFLENDYQYEIKVEQNNLLELTNENMKKKKKELKRKNKIKITENKKIVVEKIEVPIVTTTTEEVKPAVDQIRPGIDKEALATHIPLLTRVFDISEGDVLEIGTGFFSTLLLGWLATITRRHVYSYESRNYWYQRAKKMSSKYHHIILCQDWASADFDKKHWGLVFIDHSPDNRRPVEIERLKDKTDYMVIHDTDPERDSRYGYSRVLPMFKYRYDYKKIVPHTTVVSNIKNLDNIK